MFAMANFLVRFAAQRERAPWSHKRIAFEQKPFDK
jgi:hypothetical protein